MSKNFWRYDDEEKKNILDSIESGFKNKWNVVLEEKFSSLINTKYAIGVNSGTSALHASLFACGVKAGDEVITTPLTFAAPAIASHLLGATTVFADIDPKTFNIDINQIKKRITDRTKAIIPVSLYGLPTNIDEIMLLASSKNIKVIEDNAECLLGSYPCGNIAGSKADISIFSFQRSKHITSETGGIIVSNDSALAERARKFSILGYQTLGPESIGKSVTKDQIQNPKFIRHDFVAPNYRLAELCAAAMVAQVEKAEILVTKRIQIANLYKERIKSCDWIVAQYIPKGFKHSYWTYTVKIDINKSPVSWKKFREIYVDEGGSPFYAAWLPVYLEPAFYKKKEGETGRIYESGLCPIVEELQPQLIQLKTNFANLDLANRQAEILEKTIRKCQKM
ncbi:MAG: histidine kinase [Candidatus Marinimicrobia bacterium]|nr:histidine kinase [Candidatus Neomarinimicrobiota bacterium]|tara:strand:+ start:2724 stop:3908 length:1185 start_codon:yes stop_codon:yes gene_type:complete